ncbi:MAG: hypothetical protein WED07_14580 [Candidatus Freyarchaeum deiterrae]
MSFKDFSKYFSEKSKGEDQVQKIVYMLKVELSKGMKDFGDEEDLKDSVRDICLSFDPTLLRDQIIQGYMGAHNVDFILLGGLLAMEVKLVRNEEDLQVAVPAIISHIPAFSSMYRNVLFLVYDSDEVIKNPEEFKRTIESKSENITILVIKRESAD